MNEIASRPRWAIVGLLTGFSVLSYVLRMNISIASPSIMTELSLNQIEMGRVFSSFMLGYAIFQIPAGMLGDRWGARRMFLAAGIWWGLTTILTALGPGSMLKTGSGALVYLLVIRFALGAGEAATYPVANHAIAHWVPSSRRAFSNAIVVAGASVGATATPPMISWLMVHYGWRSSFYLTGCIALLFSFLWWTKSADVPEDHFLANRSQQLPSGRSFSEAWRIASRFRTMILRRQELWILSLSYLFDGYVLFIFVFWLYTYLTEVRGFSLLRGGIFSSFPFAVSSLMTPLGGVCCDWCCARFGANRGRRIAPVGGLLLSALCLSYGARVANPYVAVGVLSLSVGFVQFTEGAYWTTATDICPSDSGAASGFMNMFGNFGGVFSTALVPLLVKHFGWMIALTSGSVMAVISAVLWAYIRVDRTSISTGDTTRSAQKFVDLRAP